MMSEQHNTSAPEAGALNLAPTESEPALSNNTTLNVMSDTENAGAIKPTSTASKPARSRSKKGRGGEQPSTRKTARKRGKSNADESVLPPSSSLPAQPISPASSETAIPPASPTTPEKTSRKKQPTTGAKSKRAKKADAADKADTPVETPLEAPAIESEKKLASSAKRRSTKPRKKAVKEVEPFEPDLDATPVKPRDTIRNRASIVIEPDLDSSPFTVEPEVSPSTLEETRKRPVLRIEQKPEVPTTEIAQRYAARVIESEVELSPFEPDLDPTAKRAKVIPETPLPPASIEVDIPETPLPSVEDRIELAPVTVDIPETPLPLAEEQEENTSSVSVLDNIAETPIVEDVGARFIEPSILVEDVGARFIEPPILQSTPVAPILQSTEVVTPVPIKPEKIAVQVEQPRPVERRRLARTALVLCLLALFLTSSLLLWRDANDTHLYLYHIEPANGQVQAQQDLGGGYHDAAALTNPVLLQSSLLLGVSGASTSQAGPQQILTLSGSDTSWHVAAQHSAQLAHSTLSVTPNNLLVVEYAGGLQVMTPDGQMLWQVSGNEPTLGAHAFAPAFDTTTVYSIKNASKGLVAAYDLSNGATRWTRQLADTLAYAPPMLLYENIVFVAGDHTLYALNSATGSILWKAAAPTRTLLAAFAAQPLLIAVGAQGLKAFNPQTGHSIWSFNGQPGAAGNTTVTAAQFYQAGISHTNNVIYATGIAWDAQTVQEQLWLFAIEASTGKPRWSQRIGEGFTAADAGRIFTPYVDAVQGLVLLEQVQADGSHALTAYNTGDGTQRWRIQLAGVTAAAPNLIQASNDTLSIFSVQTDARTALQSWSSMRLLLLAMLIASVVILLLLWMLPFRLWLKKMKFALRRTPRILLKTFLLPARLWRFSRLLFALTFVAVVISTGVLMYTQLNHTQQFLNRVEADNGKAQWQQALTTPTTLTGADSQGSLVITDKGDHLSQLSALNSNGSSRWSTFSSQGVFSLPTVSTQAGTLLVALSGHTSLNYHYAPDDAAYPHPLDHLFVLYLLDRSTGQILWQSAVVRGDEPQETTILGDDARFIYVASRSIARGNMVVQLIAVQKTSGAIAWRIFGPREQGGATPDYGTLLTGGRFIYWQANSTLYALDTELGQIEWRRYIAEMDVGVSLIEDAQMVQSSGVLFVRRSDLYHALDLTTGNERWTLPGLGSDTPQMPGGIIATGHGFILYGDGTIEAIDIATHSILWKHENLAAVSDVTTSADGSLIYAVVSNNLDDGTQHQALVAFDMKTGTARWTFQPAAQALFLYPGASVLRPARGMLFVTVCLPGNAATCAHQALYGINGTTGAVQWKVQATRISNAQVTPDGSAVMFQSSSSAWEILKARFGA